MDNNLCSGKSGMDLNPPLHDRMEPSDDEFTRNEYEILQNILLENGFPHTEDRTKCADRKTFVEERIAVAILSSPTTSIGILLEGRVSCHVHRHLGTHDRPRVLANINKTVVNYYCVINCVNYIDSLKLYVLSK